MSLISIYTDDQVIKTIKAYLVDGWSYRRIQEDILGIPAPERGGGFEAMKILHHFGIKGDKKEALMHANVDEEIKRATGQYRQALVLLKNHVNL